MSWFGAGREPASWYELAMSSDAVTDHPPVGLATVRRVADAFDLGAVTGVETVAAGLMNRTWRVTTGRGVWAVKEIVDVTVDQARRQHRAATALADHGLPVPVPVVAGDDTVAVIDGAAFGVLPWVTGEHRGGLDLRMSDAAAVGRLLARLHLALAAVMPAAANRSIVAVTDAGTATAQIDRYLAAIARRATRDTFDRFAEAELHRRRLLLDRVAVLRPAEGIPVRPCGWTHGDFQHLNLLWQAGRVCAVLDWDRLDVRPLGLEVVRSATLLFGFGDARGLDLNRVTAFTAGYRTTNPDLTDADLADAVHRLWWERVSNDLWHLRLHYDRGSNSCDHYFHSASALLTWWTDHRHDVAAAFTAGSIPEPVHR